MEAGFVALAVMVIVLGVIGGIYLGKKMTERRYAKETEYTQGTLSVDCVDPEFQPGLFLALSIPVSDVIKRKYIMLDINLLGKNSHE